MALGSGASSARPNESSIQTRVERQTISEGQGIRSKALSTRLVSQAWPGTADLGIFSGNYWVVYNTCALAAQGEPVNNRLFEDTGRLPI